MLGEMKMTRLVPKVAVPIMISMLVQALYNVVDSIFVARYSADALTAVSLANPMQLMIISLSVGMGVGVNSLISRLLGEKRPDEARRAAWNGILIQVLGYLVFLLVGILIPKRFIAFFSPDENLQELGASYLRICCCGSLGVFMSVLFERLLQSTGNTVHSMLTQLSGAVTNLILDPILIFGFLGFRPMGIAGAALATVIGQWVSMLVGFLMNQRFNRELRLSLTDCRIRLPILRDIVAVGFPSTVMSAIGSVLNVLINMLLISYGNDAVSVMGVYFKMQSFVFMPVFGLGNGLVPIVGYNYGARIKKRVYEAIRVAIVIALGILVTGMLCFQLFPAALMSLFESGEPTELTRLGVRALRTISLGFPMAAIGVILGTVFQAVGKGMYSMIVSVCRQLLVLLPTAWLLSNLFGLDGIWWAFPAAELISLIISLLLYRRCDRRLLKPMPD